jgi:hypothetical protein
MASTLKRASAPGLTLLLGLAVLLAGPAAAAGSPSQPDVLDDGVGEAGLAPEVNVLSGWVAGETATAFSLFMKIQSLAAPPQGSFYQYHFHFEVQRTDGTTSLYHGMVHHSAAGAWTRMVQRWLPSGGLGSWGATNDTTGQTDLAAGVLEVQVRKAWIEAPKADIATNLWSIGDFYIHADRVNVTTQAIEMTDSAPSSGTMGSATLSLGAPAPPPSPSAWPVFAVAVAVVGVGTAVVLFQRRT